LRLAILPRHPLLCYSLKCLEWVFCEVRKGLWKVAPCSSVERDG
jgi:hypothetical protein